MEISVEKAMENIIEVLVKRAGERIFHVSAPALYVNNPEDGIWTIEFEGIIVTWKIYIDPASQLLFEVTGYEDKRKLVGIKFTI